MLIFEQVLSGPKTLVGERCHMAVPLPVGVNENPDMANLSRIQ